MQFHNFKELEFVLEDYKLSLFRTPTRMFKIMVNVGISANTFVVFAKFEKRELICV